MRGFRGGISDWDTPREMSRRSGEWRIRRFHMVQCSWRIKAGEGSARGKEAGLPGTGFRFSSCRDGKPLQKVRIGF